MYQRALVSGIRNKVGTAGCTDRVAGKAVSSGQCHSGHDWMTM
jgi:hypothetical protein